jgi:hypothetical protein
MAASMVEMFPPRTRHSDIPIGYNVGPALLGGTTPLFATGLISRRRRSLDEELDLDVLP